MLADTRFWQLISAGAIPEAAHQNAYTFVDFIMSVAPDAHILIMPEGQAQYEAKRYWRGVVAVGLHGTKTVYIGTEESYQDWLRKNNLVTTNVS